MKKLLFVIILSFLLPVILISQDTTGWINKGNYLEQKKNIGEITFIKYSNDGNYIYTYGVDSVLRKWDVESGGIIYEKSFLHNFNYDSSLYGYRFCDVSPNDNYVLVSHLYRNEYDTRADLILFDLIGDSVKYKIHPHFSEIMTRINPDVQPYVFNTHSYIDAQFSPDATYFISSVNLHIGGGYYVYNGVNTKWQTITGTNIGNIGVGYQYLLFFMKDSNNYSLSYKIEYFNQEPENGIIFSNYTLSKKITGLNITNMLLANNNNNLFYIYKDNDIYYLTQLDIEKDSIINNNSFESGYDSSLNSMISHDDRFLITSNENSLKFYRIPEAAIMSEYYYNFLSTNNLLKMNPDRNEIASGGQDGILRIIRPDIFNKELIASFKSDKNSITIGDTINFIDLSYGNPSGWYWDFGDGEYDSISPTPSHIYKDSGSYTVKLFVFNDKNRDTCIKSKYIRINYGGWKIIGKWNDDGTYLENILSIPTITFIKYSNDGKYIYTYSKDSKIRKWDVKTGGNIFEKTIPKSIINDNYIFCDISPDGNNVLLSRGPSGYNYSTIIMIYNISNDSPICYISPNVTKVIIKLQNQPPPWVFGSNILATYSPDGTYFITSVNMEIEYGYYSYIAVNLVYSSYGSFIGEIPIGYQTGLTFSRNSNKYAFSYLIDFVDYYPEDDRIYGDLIFHDGTCTYDSLSKKITDLPASKFIFTNDNKFLLCLTYENNIFYLCQWDLSSQSLISKTIFGNPEYPRNLMISNNDKLILHDHDSILSIYDFPTLIPYRYLKLPFLSNNMILKMSPIANEIATGGWDGILRIIKFDTIQTILKCDFQADTNFTFILDTLHFFDLSIGSTVSWHWDFGDGDTSNLQNPSHIYTKSGIYTVRLIVSNGNVYDTLVKQDYITVTEPSGIEFPNLNTDNIIIYPNPVSDYLEIIENNQNISPTEEIQIYNSKSELVMNTCKIELNLPMKIDVSSFSSGMYFLKIGGSIIKFVKKL